MKPGYVLRHGDVVALRDAPVPPHACAPGVDPGFCGTCGERYLLPIRPLTDAERAGLRRAARERRKAAL